MNNLIKRVWTRKELVFVEDLRGMAFTNEDGAHTFSIAGKDENGADLALSGTVAGSLIRPDGTTTAMTGTIADGCANVTLSPECYGVSGRASLTIFLTSGGQKTAIYHAVMSIGKSSTSQVSPGVAADVVDLVNRIDTATASIPATYTALLGSIASDYDPSKTYKTGEHVWYGGYLYKAKQDIDTAESWTSGHWTKVVLADDFRSEITSLKSALTDLDGVVGNYIYSATPNAGNNYVHIPIADSVSTGTTIYAQALTVPADVDYILLIGQYSGQRDLIDLEDGEPHLYTTVLTYTNVEVVYHLTAPADGNTKYSVVCIKSDDPVSIAKDLFETKTEIAKTSTLVDSPFAVEISNKFKGIVAFEFLITDPTDASFSAINNQQYRVTNIYYKDAFYLYMSLQRYANGSWSSYDSVKILLADAPTETALMVLDSTYGRFRVAIIPGLMTAGRATSVEYLIKNTAVNPFITKLQSDLDKYVPYDSYVVKDTISNRVTVKKDGTGDFTTISAAYAAINKKSSFFNQYEICVYPGTYNEINLICPPYTHTHGMFPNTVTVTSEGETGTLPVFDQKSFPSKLSNMKIVSATGYCIHVDNPLIHSVVNENLYCKKVYASDVSDFGWESISTSAIIGMGAQPAGMMIVFDGCTFENGAVVCHTNSSSDENADFSLVFNNCKVLNARIQLNKAGNTGAALYGNWLCKINNLAMIKGQTNPGIALFYGDAVSGMDYNFGWQIIGGNINTAIEFKKGTDTTAPDCWDNIELTEKSYVQAKSAITKGQWITDGMIPATANERAHNIIGVALADASSGDTFPVWVGNAYSFTGTNGEYGIGSDGTLSASATEKIGKIINNIFYRY